MAFTTLLSARELDAHLFDPEWAIIDCRFDLTNPAWGEPAYAQEHIPGAVYAHLDRDLSGPKTGRNGRHPLPEPEAFRARLSAWGLDARVQVVAYDQANGMWASRLWWMLRWMGHAAVAVLDGGLAHWLAEGRPTLAGVETRQPRAFAGQPRPELAATAEAVEQLRLDPAYRLLDARAPERFRGEVEPIDPVAGHIPGAVSAYNLANVTADGAFLPPAELRARFLALLGGTPPANAVAYCGSGVAAAHNVL
ncbi:MAG: sulfurtransferase, partial [Anaerolineales bacterium]|nr:sulfurtransferase [Anaerolineales bacterium]